MLSAEQEALFDSQTKHNVVSWLEGNYDGKTKATILQLLEKNPQEITDAFYTSLTFGTGGLRGIMGVGTNRMNQYTVQAATQGLANYLQKHPKESGGPSVFISYDSRHQSRFFAEEASKVLAANSIRVYLTKALRPTPLVSFGCRHYHCSAAVMITASHNPPEYNGYKVYWEDGGQITPPHDQGIIDEVNKITDIATVKATSLDNPLIQEVGEEVDEAYLEAVKDLQHYPQDNHKSGKNLSVVFSNLHGTGITLVPHILKQWGFTKIIHVEEQKEPDGAFPTVKSPNPEVRAALEPGIEAMKNHNADILLATDPDADRVGMAVNHGGDIILLNGNEISCLCLHHICEALTQQKRMPEKAAFIKTIVTTELFAAIAEAYNRPCFNVLTGFKNIAQLIHQWEQEPEGYEFVFGGEESYGYLLGTHCRDKDAVIACALICEVALHAKKEGKTLIDLLHSLYEKYGIYRERLLSVTFGETKAGKEQMQQAMNRLRQASPTTIDSVDVTIKEDYLSSTRTNITTGATEKLSLPKSDVLLFWLADHTKVVVRPSGTEPKVKLYCGVTKETPSYIPEDIRECDQRTEHILQEIKNLLLKH